MFPYLLYTIYQKTFNSSFPETEIPPRKTKKTYCGKAHTSWKISKFKNVLAVKKLLMCLTNPTQTLILRQEQSVRTFITSAIAHRQVNKGAF